MAVVMSCREAAPTSDPREYAEDVMDLVAVLVGRGLMEIGDFDADGAFMPSSLEPGAALGDLADRMAVTPTADWSVMAWLRNTSRGNQIGSRALARRPKRPSWGTFSDQPV
jgi:hypothetical protein